MAMGIQLQSVYRSFRRVVTLVVAALLGGVLTVLLAGLGAFLMRYWFEWTVLGTADRGSVPFLGLQVPFTPGSSFMVIALAGGALGGALHGLVSLTAHLADRTFDISWCLWYLTNPLIGAALATTFLLALQAGLTGSVSAATSAPDKNLFGIAAAATLTGLFTRHALAKLKQIFDVAFNVATSEGSAPTITKVDPPELVAGQDTDVTLTGTGFDEKCRVDVDGRLLTPKDVTATRLIVSVPAVSAGNSPLRARVRTSAGVYSPTCS